MRGPFGAYSLSDLQKGGLLVSIGDRIYDLIKDPKYDNWLFVFGTVILAQSVYVSSVAHFVHVTVTILLTSISSVFSMYLLLQKQSE